MRIAPLRVPSNGTMDLLTRLIPCARILRAARSLRRMISFPSKSGNSFTADGIATGLGSNRHMGSNRRWAPTDRHLNGSNRQAP